MSAADIRDQAAPMAPELSRQCSSDWLGDATSVVEFLRPLRERLDAPGVLEVCVNRPGQLQIETVQGWHSVEAPAMTLERCLSLATAVATYSDQQISHCLLYTSPSPRD